MKKLSFLLSFVFILLSVNAYSDEEKEVSKTFDAKDLVEFELVSGDCIIKKGESNKIKVHLIYTYSDDCFEYIFKEETNKLKIKEDFDGSCSGWSKWTIILPENTEIKFASASGDLEIEGMKKMISSTTASGDIIINDCLGELSLTCASGNIEFRNISGEVKITTASGDIEGEELNGTCSFTVASGDIDITNAKGTYTFTVASGDIDITKTKGTFDFTCASGDVTATEIITEGESSFTTASGSVYIRLSESLAYDTKLTSASGNAILDYNGNNISGTFEFVARVKKGEIISPIKFDKEEIFTKNGKEYYRKSFTKGNKTPEIKIETSTGRAELLK